MKQPNIERLKRLVEILQEVKADKKHADKFNMGDWGLRRTGCGTHHCAAGWAATDKQFKKDGFKLVFGSSRQAQITYTNPETKDFYDGYEACEEFFEIDSELTLQLFSPGRYPAQKWEDISFVIRRLKAVVTIWE